jgi:SPP1 gp7 family putative phage head morphogenesis protein
MAKQIDINSLANAIYQGKITPRNLPEVVYHFNAEKIVDGIYKGFGKSIKDVAYDSPEFKMLNSLRENAYIFSGAKTFQQTLAMTEAMTDGDKVLSFDDFKSKVEDLNIKFNENYLETEYNTAIASSQNASSWERFEQDADVLPFLTYQTIGEACEICLPLDGITLPVDDEFWNKYYPPNHFNCFCICMNSDNDANLTSKDVRNNEMQRLGDLVSDTFQTNSGKSGQVFDKDHPYFLVPKEYKEFAKDNFGLTIPKPEDE